MRNKKILIICLFVVILAIVAGVSYALFNYTGSSSANTIESGQINFTYTEPSNSYVVDNALATDDATGKSQDDYFEFTVSSNATTNVNDSIGVELPYEISIESVVVDNDKTALTNDQIKVYLTIVNNNNEIEIVSPVKISSLTDSAKGKLLLAGKHIYKNKSSAQSTVYRLRAWISDDVDVSSWDGSIQYQYKFRVNVNASAKNGKILAADGTTDDWEIDTTPNESGGYTLTGFVGNLEDCDNVETIDNFFTSNDVPSDYFQNMKWMGLDINSVEEMTNKSAYNIMIPSVVTDGEGNEYKITEIGEFAFSSYIGNKHGVTEEYTRIKSVTISEGIKVINKSAFEKNYNLESVVLPTSLVVIGDGAFENTNISNIELPSNLKSIGKNAFISSKISEIIFPDSLEEIGASAFFNNKLTDITIPGSVKVIEASAFRDNPLSTITLEEGIEEIEESAFMGNNIRQLTIPSTVGTVGKTAFAYNLLETLVLNEGLNKISDGAFMNNYLKEVTIPSTVTVIENNAFVNNSSMKKVINSTGKDFDWSNIVDDQSIVINN